MGIPGDGTWAAGPICGLRYEEANAPHHHLTSEETFEGKKVC